MEMSIRFPGLDLVLNFVPRSFWIFGMDFTIYGVLIAIGALLGMGLVTLETKRNGEDQNKYLDMMIVSLLFSVVGSRLFYVAFSWGLYKGNISGILDFRKGGYAFYGGLLAGVLAAAVFCWIKKMSFWQAADTACLGILLGQVTGRWGNFFNRESFGEYADFPWVMQLPLSAVRSGEVSGTMRDNLLTINGISYIQVQPVFLYESLWCLLLLLVLMALRRKKKFEGELFMIYLAGYGFGRFFFEWLRTDKLYIPGTRVGVSMVISALLVIICVPVIIVRGVMTQKRAAIRRRRRKRILDESRENKAQDSEPESGMQADPDSALEMQNLPDQQEQNTAASLSDMEASSEKDKNSGKKQSQMKDDQKKQEESEENMNWENSEYAHIPEQWRRHVGNPPTNSKEDL